MNQSHTTAPLIERQDLITQVQQLAARYPEQGIKPDNVPLQPPNELAGTLAYLKRIHSEKGGGSMLKQPLKSEGGFDIAVLTHEKQANPIQGEALPFCEMGINDRSLIISHSSNPELSPVKESIERAKKPRIKRTINRKQTTYESTITYYGKCYRINNGKEWENLGLYPKILHGIIEQFEISLMRWKRVFVLRFELHLAYETANNKCITDFKKRLFQKLRRIYGFKEIGYAWAREYHGKGKGQHYHFVIFLDGSLIQHSSRINGMIRLAWQRPNGSYTIGKIERPFYFVNNEEIAQDAIYRVSYLAKTRGKGHRPPQTKDFNCSRMKPVTANGA